MITREKLKEFRTKKGFTQIDMARMVGVTVNTYRNWEQGANDPSEENLIKLQELLKDN